MTGKFPLKISPRAAVVDALSLLKSHAKHKQDLAFGGWRQGASRTGARPLRARGSPADAGNTS